MTRQIDLRPLIAQLERYLTTANNPYNTLHQNTKDLRIEPEVASDVLECIVTTCANIINTNGGSHDHLGYQLGLSLAGRDLLTSFTYNLPGMLMSGWSEFSGDTLWPIYVHSLPGQACEQYTFAKNTSTAFVGEYGAANFRLCEYLIVACNRLLENPVIDFSPEGSDYR